MKVKDKIWLWGHLPGVHKVHGVGESTITPREAALYLDINKLLMVRFANDGMETPYDTYAEDLKDLKTVIWSVVGAAGMRYDDEAPRVAEIMKNYSNIDGIIMDDFFNHSRTIFGRPKPYYSPSEVDSVRNYIDNSVGRKIKIWTVLYKHLLKKGFDRYNKNFDVYTYWTWKSKDLKNLEQDFRVAENEMGDREKLLGCYMYDYAVNDPMPVDRMAFQCELALEWLKTGRIDGIIFLASCICDLGLESVKFTRNWIQEHGEEEL